ncbi:MAG TPA: hypothetical protein VF779_07480 [Pyrinomonadaceae bacterium]
MRKSVLMLIVLCGGLLFLSCKQTATPHARPAGPPKSDVDFAKQVFQMMADGDINVVDMLDWESLKIAGMDIGAQYKNVSSDSTRETFQESFLRGYSKSFQSSGGNVSAMTNWREQSKDPSGTVVASNLPNGQTILFTVTNKNGLQYVSTIDVK